MSYTIRGPGGTLAHDGVDVQFFQWAIGSGLPCPRLRMLWERFYGDLTLPPEEVECLRRELESLRHHYRTDKDPQYGVRARDPQVREQLLQPLRQRDPVDSYLSRFCELCHEAAELGEPMDFLGD